MLILIAALLGLNLLFTMAMLVQLASINQHIAASFNIEYKEEIDLYAELLKMRPKPVYSSSDVLESQE